MLWELPFCVLSYREWEKETGVAPEMHKLIQLTQGDFTCFLFEIHFSKTLIYLIIEGDLRQTDCDLCWLLAPCPNQKKKLHGLMGVTIWSGRKCPLDWESGDLTMMTAPVSAQRAPCSESSSLSEVNFCTFAK